LPRRGTPRAAARRVHRISVLFACLLVACGPSEPDDDWWNDGKGDGFGADRQVEVVLTEPFCDVCTAADKTVLQERSPIVARLVELIESAEATIEVANFTFSVRTIEQALLRAHERGIAIRIAMDRGQDQPDTVASRLRAAGIAVRFVSGGGEPAGLQHAKFLVVDGVALATGSNNWSSTGTSINEENTIVIRSVVADPLLRGFGCHFEAMWAAKPDTVGACSTPEARFAPGGSPHKMIQEELRRAEKSIDVLMHHLVFDDLVKELARAAERGVRVRVIVNAADRAEHRGSAWNRLFAAGGRIRYKQHDPAQFQLMHHKLAVIDGRIVVNGSGNWSGSAFFKNHENFVRYRDPRIARPFRELFDRLWLWSLSAESLDAGRTAAEQHAAETRVFFGSLHAHYPADAQGVALDDGKAIRMDASGAMVPVDVGPTPLHAARFAYEYARDDGGMDFLALTPHTCDDGPPEAGDQANMLPDHYRQLAVVAGDVTRGSGGQFVAIAGMEWSTNSTGNHVNVFGSRELAKLERGRFDLLYDEFLPERERDGDRPIVQLNHPRTFRGAGNDSLKGNWDQIFDVPLTEITNASERARKFNDFGLDDYEPLRSELPRWIAGEVLPDRETVRETLVTLERAARPYVRLTEVLIGRGAEIAHDRRQNPSLVPDPATGQLVRLTRVHSDWDYYLLNGFRTAPTAPHDNHFANWGTGHSSRTGLIAEALTEDALLDAIDARAVYATEDEELVVRLYAGGRVPMGGTLVTRDSRVTLSVFLDDADFTGAFEVVVLGGQIGGDRVRELARTSFRGGSWQTIEIDVPLGENFVYLEILEPSPDRMAWSAPIWIERL
jgi:phosphatidylserine/phosphatidylglycerophosphate/cardiolipin synthase-like enzyme